MMTGLTVLLDDQAKGLGSGKCGGHGSHSWGPMRAEWDGLLVGGRPVGGIVVRVSCTRCFFGLTFPTLSKIRDCVAD